VVYHECGGASCQFSWKTANDEHCKPVVADTKAAPKPHHKLRAARSKRHSTKGWMKINFGKNKGETVYSQSFLGTGNTDLQKRITLMGTFPCLFHKHDAKAVPTDTLADNVDEKKCISAMETMITGDQ